MTLNQYLGVLCAVVALESGCDADEAKGEALYEKQRGNATAGDPSADVQEINVALGAREDASSMHRAQCSWLGWSCGEQVCPGGYSLDGVDFNTTQSETCWGDNNDFDEPQRRIQCCDDPAVTDACYWTGWGCGHMECAPGTIAAGIDFNATQSEGCWGDDNDFDEPFRRVRCCEKATPPSGQCYWLPWGCGEMTCGPNAYVASIDFNATLGEGCWGDSNDFDEPFRRLQCCTK